MATTIAGFPHQYNFIALDTYNYTIVNSGNKRVNVRVTDRTNPGGITIEIKVNGSSKGTASGATAGNGVSLNILYNFTAADTLTVIVTSSAASDSAPMQIYGTITLDGNV